MIMLFFVVFFFVFGFGDHFCDALFCMFVFFDFLFCWNFSFLCNFFLSKTCSECSCFFFVFLTFIFDFALCLVFSHFHILFCVCFCFVDCFSFCISLFFFFFVFWLWFYGFFFLLMHLFLFDPNVEGGNDKISSDGKSSVKVNLVVNESKMNWKQQGRESIEYRRMQWNVNLSVAGALNEICSHG